MPARSMLAATAAATAILLGCAGCAGPPDSAIASTSADRPQRCGKPAAVLPQDDYRCTNEVPITTGPGRSTASVEVITPDSSSDAALDAAIVAGYDQNDNDTLPPTCQSVRVILGTIHIARVRASGTEWAIAGFAPGHDCVNDQGDPASPDPRFGPFAGVPGPPVDLFRRLGGGPWGDVTAGNANNVGKPFPCPHGLPGALVPPAVLHAWEMPYYSEGCTSDAFPIPG